MRPPHAPAALRVPLVLRLYHWALAGCCVGAWALAADWREAHEWLGYGAAALVAWRAAYGWFVAPPPWRFARFVVGPRAVLRFAVALLRGHAPLAQGYNPLAGWAIVTLLAVIASVSVSGWLLTTDRFWGDEAMQTAHGWLVDAMWALIALHLAGVAVGSWRARAFLPRAMLDGHEPPH